MRHITPRGVTSDRSPGSGRGRASGPGAGRARRTLSLLVALTLLVAAGQARADAVTDWNQTAMDVLKAANVLGNPWSRSMAMVHVAMADAVNTIQDRYTRHALAVHAAPGASADAAVAAAARGVLTQLYPGQKAKVEEAYEAALGRLSAPSLAILQEQRPDVGEKEPRVEEVRPPSGVGWAVGGPRQ